MEIKEIEEEEEYGFKQVIQIDKKESDKFSQALQSFSRAFITEDGKLVDLSDKKGREELKNKINGIPKVIEARLDNESKYIINGCSNNIKDATQEYLDALHQNKPECNAYVKAVEECSDKFIKKIDKWRNLIIFSCIFFAVAVILFALAFNYYRDAEKLKDKKEELFKEWDKKAQDKMKESDLIMVSQSDLNFENAVKDWINNNPRDSKKLKENLINKKILKETEKIEPTQSDRIQFNFIEDIKKTILKSSTK